MKYRVYKSRYDSRLMTHGIVLPDGFFRVFEMTRHNGRQVESFIARGYTVEEEEDSSTPCGVYDELTGKRVTDESIIAAIDGGGREVLKFIRDGDQYDDPMATVGMPKSLFKRGYQPPIKGSQPDKAKVSKDDVRAEQRTLHLKKGAA